MNPLESDVELTIKALRSLAAAPLYTTPVTYAAWCRDAAAMLVALKLKQWPNSVAETDANAPDDARLVSGATLSPTKKLPESGER